MPWGVYLVYQPLEAHGGLQLAKARLLSAQAHGSANIVTIRKLSKIYRQGEINVTALHDISLDIQTGEFLTLMGPSGSGKSTLLHIIAGIDRPTSGECRVQEVDVARLNESQLADWRNQNVGFVFQTFNLIPVLTAFENVELPLLLTRLEPQATAAPGRNRPGTRRVGGPGASSATPAFRRTGAARGHCPGVGHLAEPAWWRMSRPATLIRNRPTMSWAYCKTLSKTAGKTVIMVTHDPKAAAFGSRTIHLEKGELISMTIVKLSF